MKTVAYIRVLVVLIFTTTSSILGQWVQTNGPPGGNVRCLAVSGTNLFAGTERGGVLLSTNNGTRWTAVNTGLTDNFVYAFAVSGMNLFTGTGLSSFPSWSSQKEGPGMRLSSARSTRAATALNLTTVALTA